MKRLLRSLLGLFLAAALAVTGWMILFAQMRLDLPQTPFEFRVRQGTALKSLSRQLADMGLLPEANSFWILGRLLGKATGIQAGTYRLVAALTPLALLDKLNSGDVVPVGMIFVEGTTFAEMLRQLNASPEVRHTLHGLSEAEIMRRVGVQEKRPEGLFFPDTYHFASGSSDVEILRRSYQAMKQKLGSVWESRNTGLPYESPYDALIMASIIEKETGRADERPLIASVFTNRLHIGMRLQTDPTVIYGLGDKFDGNIRKRDLTTDTPYNTYTRDGLPPAPIAMPGLDSLRAAVNPAQSDKLYFVGKGDGSHYFSRTLEEHNRAVAKYQLGR
jgi:UPF0755 protein